MEVYSMLTKRPRGTNDFLPDDTIKWQWLEEKIRDLCSDFGYGEIRTPTFEHTELFIRGVGETTDIVEKEMYTFLDKGERSITLRPEGTASVVRAFLEHKIYSKAQPTKMYYVGPMYRYDRPQAGRYRQFHQFGVEAFGSIDPAIDAEVITLAMELLNRLGLDQLALHINSVGCPECRPIHKQELKKYLEDSLDKLCDTCRQRYEKNPLRIFDCKSKECQELIKDAPSVTSCLCEECRQHFDQVCNILNSLGVSYEVDEGLVRGLDYYTRTTFEILVEGIGAQSAICGGGRYDKLVEQCGGPDIPGIGFAIGLERLLMTLDIHGIKPDIPKSKKFFMAYVSDETKIEATKLVNELRQNRLAADMDYMGRSLKAQLKYADKLDATYTLILGEEELQKGKVTLRDMLKGEQHEVMLENLIDYCKKLIK
jgi:histidyl-tRNA synthetase